MQLAGVAQLTSCNAQTVVTAGQKLWSQEGVQGLYRGHLIVFADNKNVNLLVFHLVFEACSHLSCESCLTVVSAWASTSRSERCL